MATHLPTLEPSSTIKEPATVATHGLLNLNISTKAPGKMDNAMEKEIKSTRTDLVTTVTTLKINAMEQASTNMPMAAPTKALGRMTKNQEIKALSFGLIKISTLDASRRVSVLPETEPTPPSFRNSTPRLTNLTIP